MKGKVSFVQITPNAEENIAYIARVSNPQNQENSSFERLLKYCIRNSHWSIFEQAYLTLEIETSLAIATQILRHRSFTFQQFSQRYADASVLSQEIPLPDLRRQDTKNRQNSINDLPDDVIEKFQSRIQVQFEETNRLYNDMLEAGVAKECARFVLPQATTTRLYMTGSARSWIHYLELRCGHGTQKEHEDIADACKKIFSVHFPTVALALEYELPEDVSKNDEKIVIEIV